MLQIGPKANWVGVLLYACTCTCVANDCDADDSERIDRNVAKEKKGCNTRTYTMNGGVRIACLAFARSIFHKWPQSVNDRSGEWWWSRWPNECRILEIWATVWASTSRQIEQIKTAKYGLTRVIMCIRTRRQGGKSVGTDDHDERSGSSWSELPASSAMRFVRGHRPSGREMRPKVGRVME